ncbi:hypothetical protein BDR26DRAFT_917933 [Obelidium mucronatum]|nr:hypothetical protein BDR26DRAFT_917933 [Obelidium mucronatum]
MSEDALPQRRTTRSSSAHARQAQTQQQSRPGSAVSASSGESIVNTSNTNNHSPPKKTPTASAAPHPISGRKLSKSALDAATISREAENISPFRVYNLRSDSASKSRSFASHKSINMRISDDGGNDGDKEDASTMPITSSARRNAHTKPIFFQPPSSFSESEEEENSALGAAPNFSGRQSRSKTPKVGTTTSSTPKDKSKRKRFTEEDTPSTAGSRKRALRGKTPVSETSRSRDATPIASRMNEEASTTVYTSYPVPLYTSSSSITLPESTSGVVKPVALRRVVVTATQSPQMALRAELCLPSSQLTPKAITESAFHRYGSTKKSVCKDIEMDEFFNSPTQKSMQSSHKKRSSSPTPTHPSQLGIYLTSDSEPESAYSSSFGSSSDSTSNGSHPWLKGASRRPKAANRRLFVGSLDKVDSLTDQMNASLLETPLKARRATCMATVVAYGGGGGATQQKEFIAKCLAKPHEDKNSGAKSISDSDAAFPLLVSTDAEDDDDDQIEVSMIGTDHNALALVFRYMIVNEMDVLHCAEVCKLWKGAAEQEIWRAPVFVKLSAMFKMHQAIYGDAVSTKTLHGASLWNQGKKSGIRGMLGMVGVAVDPSSPRKLLFPGGQTTMPTPAKEPDAKEAFCMKPNPKLAKLVQSVAFHLFYPGDMRYPPKFDVQSFLTDTFPNLTALSLSGTPQWVNPYFLARIASCPRLRRSLASLELSCGVMDKLTSDENTSHEAVAPMWEKLSGLKRIVVNESRTLDDAILKFMGKGSFGLEEVRLIGCFGVTEVGILELVKLCGKTIKILEISCCPKVGDGFLKGLAYHYGVHQSNSGGGISSQAELKLLKTLVLSQKGNGLFSEEGLLSLLAPAGRNAIVALTSLSVTLFPTLSVNGVNRIVENQQGLLRFQIQGCPNVIRNEVNNHECVYVK